MSFTKNSNASQPAEVKARLIAGTVIAIVRGDFLEHVTAIGQTLLDAGVATVEVTMNSPDALASIAELAQALGDRLLIGAGTVTDPANVARVDAAGGQFVVAPNVDADVISAAHAAQLLMIPGAYTATEVVAGWKLGAGMVKLFPAMPSGPAYLRALRGPLSEIPFVPTGGISADNAADFIAAGAAALGVGGSLINSDVRAAGGLVRLRQRAERLMQVVTEARKALD